LIDRLRKPDLKETKLAKVRSIHTLFKKYAMGGRPLIACEA